MSTCPSLLDPELVLYPEQCRRNRAPIDFYPSCFQQLTNPSSRNSHLFTSIQNAGGVPHSSFQRSQRSERSNVLTVRVSRLEPAFTPNPPASSLESVLPKKHRGWVLRSKSPQQNQQLPSSCFAEVSERDRDVQMRCMHPGRVALSGDVRDFRRMVHSQGVRANAPPEPAGRVSFFQFRRCGKAIARKISTWTSSSRTGRTPSTPEPQC